MHQSYPDFLPFASIQAFSAQFDCPNRSGMIRAFTSVVNLKWEFNNLPVESMTMRKISAITEDEMIATLS